MIHGLGAKPRNTNYSPIAAQWGVERLTALRATGSTYASARHFSRTKYEAGKLKPLPSAP